MDRNVVIGIGLVIFLLVFFIIIFLVTVVFKEEKEEIASSTKKNDTINSLYGFITSNIFGGGS